MKFSTRTYMNRGVAALQLLVASAVIFCSGGPVYAATYTWDQTNTGDWSTGSNWIGGVPDGSSDIAVFPDVGGAFGDTFVTVDGDFSVGTLSFTNSGTPDRYYLECSAPFSLSVYAAITVTDSANNRLSCPLVFQGDIMVSQTNPTTLAFSEGISGAGGFTLDGHPNNRVYFTGASTYSGPTVINSGTFQAGDSNVFSPNSDFVLADSSAAVLQIGGNVPETIGSLSGGAASTVSLWGGTLTVGNSKDTTYAGTITDTPGPASNLIKQGSGKLTLTGTNTYSGTTTINNGTLAVNGSLASSSVTVNAGATLKGSGTTPSVIANGTVAPGNSIGTLHGSSFTFQNGSVLENEINADGATDLIDASTSVTIDPGAALKIIPAAGTYLPGKTYTIISAPTVTGTFSSVTDTSGTLNYQVKYYPTHVDIVIPASADPVTVGSVGAPSTGYGQPVNAVWEETLFGLGVLSFGAGLLRTSTGRGMK